MPEETAMFKGTAKFHKSQVLRVQEDLNALRVCTEPEFFEKLKEFNEQLDYIQVELNSYLETKRKKFARFYFLADDELLSIV